MRKLPAAAESRVAAMWRGQLLIFDRQPPPTYTSKQGYKLLFIVFFLEVFVRRLTSDAALQWGFAGEAWWPLTQMLILLPLACRLVVGFAGVRISEFGLYGWGRWSIIERHSFRRLLRSLYRIFLCSFSEHQGRLD